MFFCYWYLEFIKSVQLAPVTSNFFAFLLWSHCYIYQYHYHQTISITIIITIAFSIIITTTILTWYNHHHDHHYYNQEYHHHHHHHHHHYRHRHHHHYHHNHNSNHHYHHPKHQSQRCTTIKPTSEENVANENNSRIEISQSQQTTAIHNAVQNQSTPSPEED